MSGEECEFPALHCWTNAWTILILWAVTGAAGCDLTMVSNFNLDKREGENTH
jgi:hypothetical protein